MAYEYLEYNQLEFDHYRRQQCCQPTLRHHYPMRKRSTSRRCSHPIPSHATSFHAGYSRPHHRHNENDIYELPLCYGDLDAETMPDDCLLDNYDLKSVPVPPWQRSPPQYLRRRRLAVQPNYYHHDAKDDEYFYNDDHLPSKGLLYSNKVHGGSRYLDPMTSFPLPYQSTRPTRTPQQLYNQPNQSTNKVYRNDYYYQPRYLLDFDYMDYFENEDDSEEGDEILDPNGHHHRTEQQPRVPPMAKNTPRQRHSLQHLQQRHHQSSLWENLPIKEPFPDHSPIRHYQQQPVLQPTRQSDAQRPLSFYTQAPPDEPQLLPMPQPMIYAPPFLPHHHSQLGYGIPTVPEIVPSIAGSTIASRPSIPFSPMMMIPPLPPPSLADTQNRNGITQQMDTKAASAEVTAVPTPPPSNDTKSPQNSSNVNIPSPPPTSSLSSSASATACTKQNANVENSLIPLVRSLSLGGESRYSDSSKPRRRSLFESLFSLEGLKLSRNNSLSSSNTNTGNSIPSSANTTIVPTSSTSTSSMTPIHELSTHTLTRKQSLSLEKKVKALSQRSYIWCYQVKSSTLPQQQRSQQQQANGSWVAMTPNNQIKLDPYICYYQPSAMVKGARMDRLSTLVTLGKEPKLIGSVTAMPQAKIARVYPSMFSSANYIEVLIDCLPADSQFVVMSG